MIITKLFGKNTLKNIEQVAFIVNGKIDSVKKKIVKSPLLDSISIDKLFDGFNYANVLKEYFSEDKINLLSDAYAVALGVNSTYHDYIENPSLLVYINNRVEVSVLLNENNIQKYEWGSLNLEEFENKNIYDLLGNRGIEEILYESKDEIFDKYTNNLDAVLMKLIYEGHKNRYQFRSVIIVTNKVEYIDKAKLADYHKHLKIIYTKEEDFNSLPITGAIRYMDENSGSQLKIVKIEYWSQDGHKSHVFNKYEDFTKHWYAAKPIANSENYYKVVYNDGMVKDVRIGEIESEEELPQFEF